VDSAAKIIVLRCYCNRWQKRMENVVFFSHYFIKKFFEHSAPSASVSAAAGQPLLSVP
jgi:hypothetical protein